MTEPSNPPRIRLKPGREKSLHRQHPWIFSGAIKDVIGNPKSGDFVIVESSGDQLLGIGAFSPHSQIRCRMWEFGEISIGDSDYMVENLLAERINSSIQRRITDRQLSASDAIRLVFAESDRIPGLIVDQYRDIVVVQFLSAGVETHKDFIIQHIIKAINPKSVYERSDADVRNLEGLETSEGLIFGEDQSSVVIKENGLQFHVDFQKGHKTGFYLDQRENRRLLREISNNKQVLDCFSYTGGFTVNALKGGANTVTAVDTAADALGILNKNIELNGLDKSTVETIQNDVFKQLRLFRDQGNTFDVIVLDPPKFAPTRKHAQRAARGYKDINLLAIKLLNPNGKLFTFSCSGGIDPTLFQQIIAGAASDANVDLQIIDKMSQASDHPFLTSFSEGEYLKGLICRRIR